MITTWLAALSTITLIGFVALSRAVKRAPEGYEDKFGFHFGREPQMTLLDGPEDDSSASYEQRSVRSVEALVKADAA